MDASERLIQESHFEEEVFADLDLDGVDLSEKDFIRCVFRKVRLKESRWDATRLEDCVFDGCDLGAIRVKKLAFRGVEFVGCRLTGIDWSDVAPNPTVAFDDCNLQYGSFVDINLTKTRFRHSRIVEVNFIDTRLAEADFDGSDLAGARFEHCDLRNANFAEARGVWFDPTKNKTKQTRINIETAVLLAASFGLHVAGLSSEDETAGRD